MAFGIHYSDTILGRVFTQCTTQLGLALPLYTTTAISAAGVSSLPVLNPLGSNRNVELVSLEVAWTSGTAVGAGVFLMGIPCGGGPATGAPVAVFNATTPINGLLNSGNQSKCLSQTGPGVVTLTAAGTTLPPTSAVAGPIRVLASIDAQTTASPTATAISHFVFDGTVIIPPGIMVYVASTLASVSLYGMTMVWKEIPIVPNQG